MNKLLVESYRASLRALEERYAIVEREMEELKRAIFVCKYNLNEAENVGVNSIDRRIKRLRTRDHQ